MKCIQSQRSPPAGTSIRRRSAGSWKQLTPNRTVYSAAAGRSGSSPVMPSTALKKASASCSHRDRMGKSLESFSPSVLLPPVLPPAQPDFFRLFLWSLVFIRGSNTTTGQTRKNPFSIDKEPSSWRPRPVSPPPSYTHHPR